MSETGSTKQRVIPRTDDTSHRAIPGPVRTFSGFRSRTPGPFYGCYGDPVARTPNIGPLRRSRVAVDRLLPPRRGYARRPGRAIITGMYAISIGTHHMRTTHVHPRRPGDAHALFRGGSPLRQVLHRIPARRRLLLHQQRKDRLPVRAAVDGLGRDRTARPLAQPPRSGTAVLRGVQPSCAATRAGPGPKSVLHRSSIPTASDRRPISRTRRQCGRPWPACTRTSPTTTGSSDRSCASWKRTGSRKTPGYSTGATTAPLPRGKTLALRRRHPRAADRSGTGSWNRARYGMSW